MNRAVVRLLLTLCFGTVSATSALGHTLSESHSSWQVNGADVRLQMVVPELEAKRLSPNSRDLPSSDALGRYLAAHMGATVDGKQCSRTDGPRALEAIPGFFREEMAFHCSESRDLSLWSSAFYELVPSHTNFARIEVDNGGLFEQLLTRDHQRVEVSGAAAENTLKNAGLLRYVGMGIMHIFTGLDHMSFMLGLVLISRRLKDLLFVVTGFTVGHSLTLGLAVSGILRPDAQYIDALVALTIALIGAENIGDVTHKPLPVALGLGGILVLMAIAKSFGIAVSLPMSMLLGGALFTIFYLMLTGHLQDAGRIRLLVTLVFGLIHGFGFASNLLEMRLPADRLAELLVGFNVGVEIGQLTVVLGALLLAGCLVRLRLAMPRPLFTDIAAAFLVGEGLYWFLGRTVIVS
jgi:hypothetical protein